MICTLCGSTPKPFSEVKGRKFLSCPSCNGILLNPIFFLSPEEEKKRYELHQNDVNDKGYQNFVSPIVEAIHSNYKSNDIGLDFGSGSGPIVKSLLAKIGYTIATYDPFFDPNHDVLRTKYNYIVCCEVMEHFYNPLREFTLLTSLLKKGGTLYCKTGLYQPNIDFDSWWYKNDPTHVFFYTKETLQWIKDKFGFTSLEIYKDLIVLRN